MVTKQDFQKWGKASSYTGGVLFVLGGIILFFDYFIVSFTMPSIASDLIIKTVFYSLLDVLSPNNLILVLASAGIAVGAATIIIVSAEPPDLVTGILLIVLGFLALGLSALFIVIAGILFIIAAFKKR